MGKVKEQFHSDYKIIKIDEEVVKEYCDFFNKHFEKDKLIWRVNNPDCTGFLAIHRISNQPVGFEWSIVSQTHEYRHDNFLLPLNNGMLFNAFVVKAHRGRGVFRSLKLKATMFLYDQKECEHVLSVVEVLNYPSINANNKIGSIVVGRNFLIKVLRRNLFSITKLNKKRLKIDYVLTGSKKVRI
ncbi:hypothetical protein NSQ77_14715 [Oceanobacillus sp. FSL K6-2867]|uniref:hypothetical protein n=1 Tax=Oceanobacillus sp. FSL K6-2867 TaxID=2954748 RepID=UPI0030D975BB